MSKKEKTALVPKLRFSEFHSNGEWKVSTLNSLAIKITNKNIDCALTRILTNSATDGVVDQSEYFEREIVTQSNIDNYIIVDEGDYVYNPRISTSAPAGPISKNKLGKGIMSPLYTVFRFNNSRNDFYEHYFKTNLWNSYLKTVSNTGARHDRISISAENFMKMPLPYPSDEEQQKIADCLSSLDDLITAEDKKLSALKMHKKGLMQKLFPAEGQDLPEWRFPEFRDCDKWVIYPLAEICQNFDAKRIPIAEKERKKGSTPYYGASGIVDYIDGFIFDEELLCVSEDGANLIARTSPIAFSISGKTWVNNHAHVLKFENSFTQILVKSYLNSISLSDFLTGMAQPKLNRAKLDIIPIPLPEEKEQRKIANCLSSLENLITAQAKKIEALKTHKQGLMQGLFPSIKEVGK
ncbi:restriction endonuclease subunit S [Brevibacillus centrosporus]|uniref:Type I restriction enzyme, S subunit n=1 Tax=Brevibacillus centrosporus TaxID=54910 RepID=A0A1I3U0T8_9BACL|nr:restriction endonuclease subunit S [Brevibacillus centrosporus]SFJ76333.1 type I restriction enzyme, S subunit [Brevibacillus centrosporus]